MNSMKNLRFLALRAGVAVFLAWVVLIGPACASKRPAKAAEGVASHEQTGAVPVLTELEVAGLEAPVPPSYTSHILIQGDVIDMQVFREPDFSGVFVLDDQGAIRHPLLGVVSLAGKSLSDAEAFIFDMLAKDYLVSPRLILSLSRTQSAQIVILGEVKNPGVYPMPVGTSLTLLQAIALAGGFTDLANPDRVRILRKGDDGNETIKARVSDLLRGGKQKDITLEPGDTIDVPQILF